MVSHLTVRGKFLLQEIWRADLMWDEELPPPLIPKWELFRQSLDHISSVSIPRCYIWDQEAIRSTELHIFCDASERGYAVVAYFRFVTKNNVKTSFVLAKSRVAPLKFVSVPRLELLAAVMAVRIAKSVQDGHKFLISTTTFWTDSQIV
ncbi:unnamed protein product, partial [Allacma fusca]